MESTNSRTSSFDAFSNTEDILVTAFIGASRPCAPAGIGAPAADDCCFVSCGAAANGDVSKIADDRRDSVRGKNRPSGAMKTSKLYALLFSTMIGIRTVLDGSGSG